MPNSIFKRFKRRLMMLVLAIIAGVSGDLISPYLQPLIPYFIEIYNEQRLKSYVQNNMDSFDGMPDVKIELADISDNRSTYIPKKRIIQINRNFYKTADADLVERIVIHELVHAWVDAKGFPIKGHKMQWLCKAKQVGVDIR